MASSLRKINFSFTDILAVSKYKTTSLADIIAYSYTYEIITVLQASDIIQYDGEYVICTYSWDEQLFHFIHGSLQLHFTTLSVIFNGDEHMQFFIQMLPVGFAAVHFFL
jgi:hypothetical protein